MNAPRPPLAQGELPAEDKTAGVTTLRSELDGTCMIRVGRPLRKQRTRGFGVYCWTMNEGNGKPSEQQTQWVVNAALYTPVAGYLL